MRNQNTTAPVLRKKAIALAISAALCGGQTAVVFAQDSNNEMLEEVVVTATRRETSLQDVPYNISAYTGQSLEQLEIQHFGDFVRFVPGLSFNDVGIRQAGNNNTLVMRGLTAEPEGGAGEIPNLARSTVSTYIGETPIYYNVYLTDVERIEVLRGPQGTLYGAGSLGGTLRIIPRKPETEAFDARVRGGISDTKDAGDYNYDVDVMLNVPIGETAAFRISGGHSKQAGFVDAEGIGLRDDSGAFLLEDPTDFINSGPDLSGSIKDSNDGEINHLRAALLWDISDEVEALLTYQYQESETDNYQATSPGFDRVLNLRGTNPFESELNLTSLEISAELGFATLTSATSYYEVDVDSKVDASGIYEDFFAYFYFYYPRISTISDYQASDETFVQELRLTSSGDNRVDWIIGGFYLDQDLKFDTVQTMPGFEDWFEASGLQSYFGTPVPLTDPRNLVYVQNRLTTFEELAAFGEVTFNVSDAWQITGGVRVFKQKIGNNDISQLPTCYNILESFGAGFYCGDPPLGGSSVQSSDTVKDQVFKLNTSYAVNDDTNVYFTWSQGFRNGGVNALPTVGFIDDTLGGLFPDVNSFSADKVDNWEVGIKGVLNDGALRYAAAAFYVDWKDPQARIAGAFSGIDGVGNATADARSKGFELEIQGVAGERFSYSLGYTYTDAKFKEDGTLYTTLITDGTRLPGHSKHMAAGVLRYTIPVSDSQAWHFSVDGFYRSSFENGLPGSNQEYHLDSFAIWNANIAYDYENWTFRLFGKNLSDEDAVASASLIGPSSSRLVIGRPRTLGFSVTYQYR